MIKVAHIYLLLASIASGSFASSMHQRVSIADCLLTSAVEALSPVQKLEPKIAKKYNTPQAYRFSFTPDNLDKLSQSYREIKVPNHVLEFMQNSSRHPYQVWTKDSKSVLVLNLPYYKGEYIKQVINNKSLNKLKDGPGGLALGSWYVHPDRAKALAKSAKVTVGSLEENSDVRYLASILDLSSDDLPHLRQLQRTVSSELANTFNVGKADDVRVYFHFPYAEQTIGLHLHIRVNQATHNLEKAKSFELDTIIDHLESGGTIKELILKRQRLHGGYFANSGGAEGFIKSKDIAPVSIEPNPYFDPRLIETDAAPPLKQ